MESRKYKTLKGKPLESGFEIEIRDYPEEGTKRVFMHAKFYVEKLVECHPSFSDTFSDHKILHDRDLIQFIGRRWGNILAAEKPEM